MPPGDSSTDAALAAKVGAALYARDNAARSLGIALETIGPGVACMTLTVRDDMLNGHGLCHGGVIFTLADTAFAYACNSRNRNTLAAAAEIQFLAPGSAGAVLAATARERASSGRTGIYDVDVVERATGRVIALFRGRAQQVAGAILAEPGGAP